VPLFPFHTWLPSAYAEAPTGVSMFLTGVMSKMGVYGFLRLLWPLFPGPLHAAAVPLLWLALGGVVLGAFAAMRQTDLKRMVAYSSINHVSYCLLALFAVSAATGRAAHARGRGAAPGGALLQMFNHGISAARCSTASASWRPARGASRPRRLRRRAHGGAGVRGLCGIAMFSSLGLPGLNGFVGEFLIFRGVWGLRPGRPRSPASGSSPPPSSSSRSGSACSTGRARARPRAVPDLSAASTSPCSPRSSRSCSSSACCPSSDRPLQPARHRLGGHLPLP
jgi:NADH-quinone oxidoreductase subunit M